MAAPPPIWPDIQRDLATASRHAERAAAKAALGAGDENRELAIGKHLHDAYCAAETALERVVLAIDGGLPQGRRYHHDLLDRAAQDLPGVRAAVIGREVQLALRRLLSFRHVYRHQYEDFDYALAAPNVVVAADAIPRFVAEVEDFAARSGLTAGA